MADGGNSRTDDMQEFSHQRIAQLLREEGRYRRKLLRLRWLSWLCVTAGIVFPLVAGSTLLAAPDFFGSAGWARIGGALILVAAILTGLHKGLKCEEYQAGCRQNIHALRSLVEGYEATVYLADEEVRQAIDGLEARLRDQRKSAFEIPPPREAPPAGLGTGTGTGTSPDCGRGEPGEQA